jgi:16S rRNA processing protein RimM
MTDWVVVGRIGAPFGLEGWVHVVPTTAKPQDMLAYVPWHLQQGGYEVPLVVQAAEETARAFVVKWVGCDNRDKASRYKGASLVVPRAELPVLTHAYYWADLEGCDVIDINTQQPLGRVDYLYETAQDIMVLRLGEKERHVPFVPNDVVKEVDLGAKRILVDWFL